MKMFPFVACLLFLTSYAQSQIVSPFPEGLGLEIGGGYNQLKWHLNPTLFYPNGADADRQEFSLTPMIRLSYQLHPLENVQLQTFTGFGQFGGKSAEMPTGYKDEIWIDAIDAGLIVSYQIGSVQLGPGVKHNWHLRVLHRSYGNLDDFKEGRSWKRRGRCFRPTPIPR